MCKYDVIPKTGSSKDIATPPENTYATAVGITHSKFVKDQTSKKGKGSPSSITESRVPELIPVLCSQLAGEVTLKPGGRLPLLSARPAVTLATLKRAATDFAAW